MYRHPIRSHNIVWKRLDFDEEDWEKATELNMVDPGYDNVVCQYVWYLATLSVEEIPVVM